MVKKIINRANTLIGIAFVLLLLFIGFTSIDSVLNQYPDSYVALFLYMFFPLSFLLAWVFRLAYKKKKDSFYKALYILFGILGACGVWVFIVANTKLEFAESIFSVCIMYILYKSYTNGKSNNISLLVELTYFMYFILFVLMFWGVNYAEGGYYIGNFDTQNLIIALASLSVLFVDNKFFKFYDRVMTPKEDKKETKKEEVKEEINEEKEEEKKVQKKPRTKKK